MTNKTYFLKNIGDGISSVFTGDKSDIPCMLPFSTIFYYFLLPLLIGLIILLLLKYKTFVLNKFYYKKFLGNKGYIKIILLLTNRRLKEQMVKLDKYNNFKIGKRTYSMEKVQNFIIGYDKNSIPVFMYDINFILPLRITKEKLTSEIKSQLDITEEKTINALTMKLDSSILNLVYDRKLLSDLYSISSSNEFKQKLIWVVIIMMGLAIAYYTGLLDWGLNFLGIDSISESSTAATTTTGK